MRTGLLEVRAYCSPAVKGMDEWGAASQRPRVGARVERVEEAGRVETGLRSLDAAIDECGREIPENAAAARY